MSDEPVEVRPHITKEVAEHFADRLASSRDSIVRLRQRREQLKAALAAAESRIHALEQELHEERIQRQGMLTGLLAAIRDAYSKEPTQA